MNDRITYGPFLAQTARDKARELVAERIANRVAGDPDEYFHLSGGSGPARAGWPSYGYNGSGSLYVERDGTRHTVPRGRVWVKVGDGAFYSSGLFRIVDLVAEIRSGATQAALFEVPS